MALQEREREQRALGAQLATERERLVARREPTTSHQRIISEAHTLRDLMSWNVAAWQVLPVALEVSAERLA